LLNSLEERDDKAYKYKLRVVTFMEQAAEHPEEYVLPDEFSGGVQAKKQQMRLLGKERFKFTTNAKDDERIYVRNKTVNFLGCYRVKQNLRYSAFEHY